MGGKKNLGFFGKVSYALMFLVFTIVFYFVLKLSGKLPVSWDYFSVVLIAILIILISKTIKYWLEKNK